MKIKKKIDIKFADALKELKFEQFYEVCKIFGVDVVDRGSIREIALEATKNQSEIDLSKVKMRRDFDKMTEELIQKYNGYSREYRRKFDGVMKNVIKANRTANKIIENKLIEQHNAGIENLKLFETNEIETEVSTDNAAVPSEG